MRVESKFLTADARITSVTVKDRSVIMEALVKEFMPMKVEMSPADFKQVAKLMAEPLLNRVEGRMPKFLKKTLEKRRKKKESEVTA